MQHNTPLRRVLTASEAAQRIHEARRKTRTLAPYEQQAVVEISAYADRMRRECERVGPTPERLAKGDVSRRPVHNANGIVVSHNHAKRLDVSTQIGKTWPAAINRAFEQFVADAHVLDVRRVTLDYDRTAKASAASSRVGGLGESEKRRAALHRHEFIMRRLQTFDAGDGVSVRAVLNFVLCHVESHALGKTRPQSWADVGRLIEPAYIDETSARCHARGALRILGRYLAGCYLEYWAMYGGELKRRIQADNAL